MQETEEKEKVLKLLLILIWVLALIHMVAEYYYLYWTLRWFDVLTHFLGGVWLGIGGIWLWLYSGYFSKPAFSEQTAFYIALGTGIVVGFLWELFEFAVWKLSGSGLPSNYTGDTALDIVVDVGGALVGFLILRHFIFSKKSV